MPSESSIQQAFFDWVRVMRKHDACYNLIFSTLNGAQLPSIKHAMRLKREGMTKGVPDVLCLLPAYEFHGLCIEFKNEKGVLSKEQRLMLKTLASLNYACSVCRSVDSAINAVKVYFAGLGQRKAICNLCFKN